MKSGRSKLTVFVIESQRILSSVAYTTEPYDEGNKTKLDIFGTDLPDGEKYIYSCWEIPTQISLDLYCK